MTTSIPSMLIKDAAGMKWNSSSYEWKCLLALLQQGASSVPLKYNATPTTRTEGSIWYSSNEFIRDSPYKPQYRLPEKTLPQTVRW